MSGGNGDGDGDGDGAGDGDGDGQVFDNTLYPMADGATWTYLHKNNNGQVLSMEDVELQQVDWQGEVGYLQVDSPNANGVWTESVLVRDGDLVLRVHREDQTELAVSEIVDYDPGFPRVRDSWTTLGQTEELAYIRTATDGSGQNPMIEDRAHVFTVLAVDEEITVPAGTFTTIKIERVRSAGGAIGDRAIFWFAFGVGKIREERPADNVVEELVAVSIPGGIQLP
jgi:hypothetical protein